MMLYRMEEGHPPHETPSDGEFWVEDWFTNQDLRFLPVAPDALQITTVDIGGTVGAIKLYSEDAGRTWTSIRPDDWPEGDPE